LSRLISGADSPIYSPEKPAGSAEFLSRVADTFGAVITINGNEYRLVLLDTNALSEFAKQARAFVTS
jgi:hypothetical protein